MKNILQQYEQLAGCQEPRPFGNGHINDTYLVETPQGKFILQRVNNKVFDTQALTQNLNFLFEALQKKTGPKLTPALFKNKAGDFHTLDAAGAAWRLMEFFQGCRSYAISPSEEISFRAAKAMGRFQLFLNTLPPQKFRETIPAFHNTPGRYAAFLETLKTADSRLKDKASRETGFILENSVIASETEKLLSSGQLPVRVTHNDTKLDNILFTADGQVLIIDLDTVMPGYVMYDYGDMVRTFTSPAKEDEPDPQKTVLRTGHFRALTKGYLSALKQALTPLEKETLLHGAKAIIYEQAIRFLNDFLMGNVYYKTAYPEHNLVRTRTQIKLLEAILQQEETLNHIISGLS